MPHFITMKRKAFKRPTLRLRRILFHILIKCFLPKCQAHVQECLLPHLDRSKRFREAHPGHSILLHSARSVRLGSVSFLFRRHLWARHSPFLSQSAPGFWNEEIFPKSSVLGVPIEFSVLDKFDLLPHTKPEIYSTLFNSFTSGQEIRSTSSHPNSA